MNFVGCVSIPDDEFTVLRGRDEMSAVLGPMHSVDFGQMTSESSTPAGTVSIMRVNRDPHMLLNSSGEDEYLHNTKILETRERRR